MAATTRQIRAALRRHGIEPRGKLRFLKSERIVTDAGSLVVKLSYAPHAICAYIADLRTYSKANVPAEELLFDEPIQIGDQLGLVVTHVHPVQPTRPCHAEAVGRLLRLTHDGVWPYEKPRRGDEVYCPDDWRPENVIITAEGPVMVDLDFAGVHARSRAVELAIADFSSPFVSRTEIATEFRRGYGHHPDLTPPNE